MVTPALALSPGAPRLRLLLGVIGGTLLAGVAGGLAVSSGHAVYVLAFAAVLLPVAIARRPDLGPVVILFSALAIEQTPIVTGGSLGSLTSRVPLFAGLGASHLAPADFLFASIFVIWLTRVARPTAYRPRSAMGKSLLALEAAALVGLVVGFLHHGDLRIEFLEVRPYVYLGATYFLASRLGTSERAIRTALWAVVLATGLKSLQGIGVFFQVRGNPDRPESVLAHEEALFMGLFILIVLALWLFEVRGPLRTTATCLLPFVIACDLVNTRRTAFAILGFGFVTLIVLAYVRLPTRRQLMGRLLLALLCFCAVYMPVFWNRTGALGQPARAVHSLISPDPRDASSDLYRVQEDANLKYNIARSGPLGMGFGVPIDYALPIVDISNIDPFIVYIPHDGLLYIVMRMGVFGGIAFWSVLAAGILGACRLLRSRNREIAAFGAIVVVMLVAYVLEGYKDQGFYLFRVAIVVGTMLGLMQATLRREAARAEAIGAVGDGRE